MFTFICDVWLRTVNRFWWWFFNPSHYQSLCLRVIIYPNRFSRANRNSIDELRVRVLSTHVCACKSTRFWLHQTEIYFTVEVGHIQTDKSGLKSWKPTIEIEMMENQWIGKKRKRIEKKRMHEWIEHVKSLDSNETRWLSKFPKLKLTEPVLHILVAMPNSLRQKTGKKYTSQCE